MLARKRSQGFTLVEILIVVVILGILAAIVIPQFTSASESAKSSSLLSQLQTIRSQLELYQVQHNGSYPTLGTGATTDWSQLTATTDVDGGAVAASTVGALGPYLQKAPVNPFTQSSTVGAAAAGVGWTYNSATGAITAVMEATKAAELDLDTNTSDISTYTAGGGAGF